MLFKSPCFLRSDSCSILFLQYAMVLWMSPKGASVHDTFFTKGISHSEGSEFHRNFSEDLVVLHGKDFLTFELFGNRFC